nr:hypothetical protein [Tanacetum cinerariifolium]
MTQILTPSLVSFDGVARSCDAVSRHSTETKKNDDDWDILLNDLDFGDVPEIEGVEIPPFVCKMGKNSRNKRKAYGASEGCPVLAKISLNTVKSNSDDEEDYGIQRNSFGAPVYGPKPANMRIGNRNIRGIIVRRKKETTMGTHHDEARSSRSKCFREYETVEEAMLSHCNMLNHMGCGEVIRLCVAGTDEEIFTSKAWTRDFNIEEPIYSEICHEFYSTYEFDKVCAVDKLRTKKIIKFRLYGRAFSWTLLEFAKRSLDTTTLRELIDYKGRLILEEPGIPRVAIPKALRASMQDLYERMGSIKIRQKKKKGTWRNDAK